MNAYCVTRLRAAGWWLATLTAGAMLAGCSEPSTSPENVRETTADAGSPSAKATPALTVAALSPQWAVWPQQLAANGNIAAWQDAMISAEISNLKLIEVRVNVGDRVRRGQVLARTASETIETELLQSRAAVAEAEAMQAEAKANGDRARQYQISGFLSAQQITQYLTAEKAALARLSVARARLQADQLRFAQTTVRAPDDGVISARSATVGALTQPGQELFRLIRGGRIEWRAEVSAADLVKLKPGGIATVTTPTGVQVQGQVRMVAPTVDPQTLNGLVYVDLPLAAVDNGLRAGSFVRGTFELGRARALSVPLSAVVSRDGFAYVFQLDASDAQGQARVRQIKVHIGQRHGDQVEITAGLAEQARVVARGGGFLADGDQVRVVAAPQASGQTPAQ